MPYSADPDFYQPIRIFHTQYGKSLLARLPLAPWRPLQDIYLLPQQFFFFYVYLLPQQSFFPFLLFFLISSSWLRAGLKEKAIAYILRIMGIVRFSFPFKVTLVLEDIYSIYHVYIARDLCEMCIYY